MGMFDTVFVDCPKCGKPVGFQSKAGECDLREYAAESVPVAIAKSLDGETQKCHCCGELLTLVLETPLDRVPMVLKKTGDYD